jgi:hypothetical protein
MQASEDTLVDQGLKQLMAILGPKWQIGPLNYATAEPSNIAGPRSEVDRVVTLTDPMRNFSGPVLVEAKTDLTPKAITEILRPRVELMRRVTTDAAVLIITPWLSPRTRDVLDSLGYGYLDLTGNVSFRLNRPTVVIRMVGDQRAPQPAKAYARHLRGEKAGLLVRALVDVRPPYRASELAQATGLSLAYVTRLLDTMEAEALINRERRLITSVDWRALLQARSQSYELLRTNPPVAMVPSDSIDQVLGRLRDRKDLLGAVVAITGPAAAAQVAPLTIGGNQLMIHVKDASDDVIKTLGRSLRLLPSQSSSGRVLLLRSAGTGPFIGRRWLEGVPYVGLSQLALDSLGGTGRMPAEGEAVVDFMAQNEAAWRLDDLAAWGMDPR